MITKGAGYYSKKVCNNVTAMLAYWDSNQLCRFANDAYLHWFGRTAEEMIDKIYLKDLLGPLYEMNLPYIEAAYKGHPQVFERAITAPDGKIRHSIASYTPDVINGRIEGIIVHVADVTYLKEIELELKRSKEKAEKLAAHDYLTGLPNRLFLNDRIAGALTYAKNHGTSLALCLLDLDYFKKINDSYGHLAGDEVLKESAARLKSALNSADTVYRIGGDEFVIVMEQITDPNQIQVTAERILARFRQPMTILGQEITLTLSIGTAVCKGAKTSAEELLQKADHALYQAKSLGRNRYSNSA